MKIDKYIYHKTLLRSFNETQVMKKVLPKLLPYPPPRVDVLVVEAEETLITVAGDIQFPSRLLPH